MSTPLRNLVKIRTGKLDANASSHDGIYPFFTCAENTLKIDSHSYDCECVLVAGNGDLNVKYYSGKFDAYQRTYIIESQNKKILLPKYLYHFMNSYIGELRRKSIGGVIKYIKIDFLQDAQIPLLAIGEQEKIVMTLDHAEEILKKRRQSIMKLEQLTQSLFLDMFGDPITNPKSWPTSKFVKLIKKIESGKSIKPAENEDADGLRVLKISAITRGKFKPEESKPLAEDYVPPQSHFVKKGDFLFSRANTTELVGAVAIVEDDYTNLLLPDKLWRIDWDLSVLTNEYVFSLFWTASFKEKLGNISSGTGGSMKNISQGKFLELEVAVPPLALQQKYSAAIKKISNAQNLSQNSKKYLEELQKCLMQKFFAE